MTNIYQIFIKHKGESVFVEAGIINRFYNEEEAITRCKLLNGIWNDISGSEYIVVKIK